MQYRGMTKEELKAIPKQDRPDLAVEQDFMRTMDPSLGYPPQERLVNARSYADLLRAQEAVPGDASNAWQERGPSNVGGRTRALAWDPTSLAAGGNKVWAGGVTGGLWYNNDITSTNSVWQSAGNAWDNIAISAIAFDPTNALVAYVATGEGWFAGSSRGAGIWKTTNGGSTWTQLSSTTGFLYINDLVVRNENGTGVVYAAVDATYYMGQWSPGYANYGLYRSTNGGSTWAKQTLITNSQAVSDIELDADNTLWIGTRRSPYSSTAGAQIAKSTNGTTWTTVYTVSPAISGGRTELAVGGSGSGLRVYALFESSSTAFNFIKTANGGTTWSSVTLPVDADQGIGADFTRGQAWYDLIVQVDPNNADVVLAGGIDLFRSTNGGTAWTQISKWSNNNNLAFLSCPLVHADQHAIAFKPGSSSTVIFGNDGGVFYSNSLSNAGTNSNAIASRNTGYNVTQFYSCAMNPGAGSNNFLAGAQDNGTQRYTAAGMNTTNDVIGGDGAFCFIDQTNANYQIGSYVYNNFYRSTNGGTSFNQLISDPNSTGDFINPAAYDSPNNILFSHYDSGQILRKGSLESASVGPTTTVTVANLGSGTASHLKVSPHSPPGTTTLYIGTNTGQVLRIPNAHTGTTVTATVLNALASMPAGSISCVEVGASENTLLVTYFNYGLTSVWMTTDGGTTWTSKEGNLPDMPVRWALIHPTNPNEAILATELGVWATSNLLASSPTWVPSNSGLANVRVDMLQYRSSDKMVAAATHGRGLFTSDAFAYTNTVQAAFAVDNATPCQGATAVLTDQSLGSPNAWTWTVTPSTVTYVSGTSASSQNPQIKFNASGTYSVQLTASNLSGSASTTTTVAVVGLPSAPTGNASQSFCNSGTVASLAATGAGIQWYATSTGGSALSASTALTNGSTYYASQTLSSCESTTRLAVTATVNAPAAPTGNASQSFCNSGTVASLSATGVGIQWYATPIGGTALLPSAPLINGSTYYASQTLSGCESALRLGVTVAIVPQPSAAMAVAGPVVYCLGDPISTLFQLSNVVPNVSTVQWFRNGQAIANQTSASFTASQLGYYDAVLATLPGCTTTIPGDTLTEVTPPTLYPIAGPTFSMPSDTLTYSTLGSSGAPIAWIVTGGVLVSGQGTPVVDVMWLISGVLEARMQDGPCIRTDTLHVRVSGIGFTEPKPEESVQVYPNPTDGCAQIKPWHPGDRIVLYTLDGRRLEVLQSAGKLDLNDLPAGVYQVLIEGLDGRIGSRHRLVLQK